MKVWATSAGKEHYQVRYWAGARGACNSNEMSKVKNSRYDLATRSRRDFLLWYHVYIHNTYFLFPFLPAPTSFHYDYGMLLKFTSGFTEWKRHCRTAEEMDMTRGGGLDLDMFAVTDKLLSCLPLGKDSAGIELCIMLE